MPSPPARSLNNKVLSLESQLEKELQELKTGQARSPLHWDDVVEGMEGPRLGPCPVPTTDLVDSRLF